MGNGGELDDYFWRVGVDVDGALGKMAGSEVALNAAAPGADKGEIQHSANYGACEGDEAAHPFFGGFLAEFYGKTFGNARSQLFKSNCPLAARCHTSCDWPLPESFTPVKSANWASSAAS